MEKLKRNEPVSQRVRITSYDLLVFTNRGTAGKDYDALCEAVDRLAGTRISTNIMTGDEEQRDSFGLIESSSIRLKRGLDGRLLWMEIKLSDWVFNAIRSQEVLTLHRDISVSASRWNGGFTSLRASIADARPPGPYPSNYCLKNRDRKVR